MEFELQTEQTDIIEQILKTIQNIERFIVKREKPFLNLDEASDYLGLSKHSIYSFTSRGVIPHYKTGRKIYFSIDELNNWILNKDKKIWSMGVK